MKGIVREQASQIKQIVSQMPCHNQNDSDCRQHPEFTIFLVLCHIIPHNS